MSSMVADAGLAGVFDRAHDDVDGLLGAALSPAEPDELLTAWRELERLRNRLAAVEHRFVVEAESRGLPFEYGCRDVAALLRGVLRVAPGQARARVRAADAAGTRVTLTGAVTVPPFVAVAAAQAEGAISPAHASVVVKTVEGLPDGVQAEHGERVEADLTTAARQFDPGELAKLAARVSAWVNPDGSLADVEQQARRRDIHAFQRADGSGKVSIEATAELMVRLLTTFDSMAAPQPEVDGVRDPRHGGQRRHDALLDVLEMVQRSGTLPSTGGVSATVLLTMTHAEWVAGEGVATSGHGAVIPVGEAIRIAGGDARVMKIVCDTEGAAITDQTAVAGRSPVAKPGYRRRGVVGWTDPRRLFTETQRLAMAARDGGCSFPGCGVPPAWCQAHHVIAWIDGGPTSVGNGTLVCGFHHREFERMGWACQIRDGYPAWLPPAWIDPDQKPRSNRINRRT